MSAPPTQVRRTDRLMSDEDARALLARASHGRLATVSEDGAPYCVPLLHVVMDGKLYVHGTAAKGHLRTNVEHEPRVCFEVDEASEVFPYGRFECDSTIAYRSAIVFGRIRIAAERETKRRFCDALMAKYAKPDWDRPKGFYPRIDLITVYEIDIERITGKMLALPPEAERWPAKDMTKTRNATR
jgi:uncharacterized protein